MRAFIGITAHFILNWKMKNVMLSCNRFRGSHIGERIRQQYDEAVATYGIADKVSEVVSDNASNMLKAFSMPGVDVSEFESDEEGNSSESDDDVELLCYGIHVHA